MLTVAALIAAGIAPTQAKAFADPLAAACERFSINTPARAAGFVAQCRVESAGFTALEENLFYSSPERIRRIFPGRVPDMGVATRLARNPRALANRVYSDRLGNGNEATGDGWKFRGRGLKNLTGRYNYAEADSALGRPYIAQPDLVAMPDDACLTAAWFWHRHGCNAMADHAQWDSITLAVNGKAMLQRTERREYAIAGLEVFA